MEEEPDLERVGKEFKINEALKMPGALAALVFIAIVAPRLGLISAELGNLIEEVFSLPLIFVFFIEIILNKNIEIKRNVGLLLLMSYCIYLFKNLALLPGRFLMLHWLFVVAMATSFTTVLIYYLFHRILPIIEDYIPGHQPISKRFIFLFAFLPTVFISFGVLHLFGFYGLYNIEQILSSVV